MEGHAGGSSAWQLTQRLRASLKVRVLLHVALDIGRQEQADKCKEVGAVINEDLCCCLDPFRTVVAAAVRTGQTGGKGSEEVAGTRSSDGGRNRQHAREQLGLTAGY